VAHKTRYATVIAPKRIRRMLKRAKMPLGILLVKPARKVNSHKAVANAAKPEAKRPDNVLLYVRPEREVRKRKPNTANATRASIYNKGRKTSEKTSFSNCPMEGRYEDKSS